MTNKRQTWWMLVGSFPALIAMMSLVHVLQSDQTEGPDGIPFFVLPVAMLSGAIGIGYSLVSLYPRPRDGKYKLRDPGKFQNDSLIALAFAEFAFLLPWAMSMGMEYTAVVPYLFVSLSGIASVALAGQKYWDLLSRSER